MHRTELSLFAQAFARVLEPLRGELAEGAERLRRQVGGELPFAPGALAASFEASSEELTALLRRVGGERSRVFVFGPAKAGKSTLIAALAGAYGPEVSLRPGYPCVQRMAHGDEPGAVMVHFDGTSGRVWEPSSLRLVLGRAQEELAQAARRAREKNELFDGPRDARQAVRRIDRRVNAELLERTATELYECPAPRGPLYTDYPSMLVGENEGACVALFVVRPEQLWDPASFEGVEGLLETFEHLTVVVNLDRRGQDLTATGELVRGPEREEPAQLVEAFQALIPAPALEAALSSRKARLYVVDGLDAAVRRLERPAEDDADGPEGLRLADVLSRLSELVDEHPAFKTFLQSVLRRGRECLGEARELLASPGLSELARTEQTAEAERQARQRIDEALRRLLDRQRPAWEGETLFVALREKLAARATLRAQELARELGPALDAALEAWFEGDESLADLGRKHLAPPIDGAGVELARYVDGLLRAQLADRALASSVSKELERDLGEGRVDLPLLLRPAADDLPSAPPGPEPRSVDAEAIPVRPTFGQRLSFRSEAEVRQALFGPLEMPEKRIAPAAKERRLGPDARAALRRTAEVRAALHLTERARALVTDRWSAALGTFTHLLHQHVERELARLERPLHDLAARVAELRGLGRSIDTLREATETAARGLEELAVRFPAAVAPLIPMPRQPAPRLPARTSGPLGLRVQPEPAEAELE
jgi:hypothetical protein